MFENMAIWKQNKIVVVGSVTGCSEMTTPNVCLVQKIVQTVLKIIQ